MMGPADVYSSAVPKVRIAIRHAISAFCGIQPRSDTGHPDFEFNESDTDRRDE
jgi:hypothetical protein